MPAKKNAEKPCECSLYEAFVPEQLTETNLETGDYEVFTTGCTRTTRNTFAQGHDAKLKSHLIKWETAGYEIRRNEGGVATSGDAATLAKRYNFAAQVRAGVERAAKKAARKTSEAAPKKVTARVGRWERTGELSADGQTFSYETKSGDTKTATNFTVLS